MLLDTVAVESVRPYEIVRRQIRQAVQDLGLDSAVYEILKQPLRFIEVSVPVAMDDGRLHTFTGYRSQHNDALGPTKGGIRFHPAVTPEEVKALSMWMTIKCALLALPFGGGKGGIVCNPKQLSSRELEALSRGYMQAVSPLVGPEQDVPAPDVYTNPQIMAWMMDEYSHMRQHNAFGLITGKPLVLGGSAGRLEATGRGCVEVTLAAMQRLGLRVDQSSSVIQGFGNAGSVAARLMAEAGSRVIAVSDSRGGVYSGRGLDVRAVEAHKQRTGSVVGCPGSEPIAPGDLLQLPCDVLVPAALENQIRADNAHLVHARIVAEAANGPTTPEAEEILFDRGVVDIPDVLANAGGVTVSYFEWVQNLYSWYWSEEEVNRRLGEMLGRAFDRVWAVRQEHGGTMRRAAYMVAVERIAEGMRLRGWLHRERLTYAAR